jgi:hypothetical protein
MARQRDNREAGDGWRKLAVPAVVSAAGALAGVAWTRRPRRIRETLPDLPKGGVGELTDDLREKVDSVLGKAESVGDVGRRPPSGGGRFDAGELRERRRERAERRNQRRKRTKSSKGV